MIDISHKITSLRTARATGILKVSEETIRRLKSGNLPKKGNPLDYARAAGFLGAKHTPDLIPHCHPVQIDHLDIEFTVHDDSIEILAEGKSLGRTGIEMEVLSAVSAAALTLYDLFKAIDKSMEITGITLLKKTGGKTDREKDIVPGLTAAILVASDSTAAGERSDESGLLARSILEGFQIEVVDYQIVPDSIDNIRATVSAWVDDGVHFIFTSGGTGFGPRDVTVEALHPLLEKEAPGVVEAIRSYGNDRTPRAMLSRSIAGQAGQSFIVTLPGSKKGVQESMDAVLPGLFHTREMILGGKHH